jgi:hypothetical protein
MKTKWDEGMAQVVEYLPHKNETLSSTPSISKNKDVIDQSCPSWNPR